MGLMSAWTWSSMSMSGRNRRVTTSRRWEVLAKHKSRVLGGVLAVIAIFYFSCFAQGFGFCLV